MSGIRRKERTIPHKIYLTESTSSEVSLYLADPVRKKPKYGALSVLVETLLRNHLEQLKKGTILNDSGSE
jgi:hypothetical protein